VNALFVTGVAVASQQFIEKVNQGMPGITLMTDVGDTLGFGKQEQHAGVRPKSLCRAAHCRRVHPARL
jgi:hypothetical protein